MQNNSNRPVKTRGREVVGRMILRNILARPIRTTISVLAVGIEVSMVMLVVGLTHGMLRDSANLVGGIGADVMVEAPGASVFLGLATTPLSIRLGERFAQMDHVEAVTPVLLQFTSSGTGRIWGIRMRSWNHVTGGFDYLQGGPFAGPDDVLVDNEYAQQNHVTPGQIVTLLHHSFHVAGVVEHGKGARLFIPLATEQRLSGREGKASIFFIKCTDHRYTGSVINAIKKLLPNHTVLSVQDYMSLLTSSDLPALTGFITAMIAIAVIIGFLVIFLSMYTTTAERTREIGILKSLGATKVYIAQLILIETGALSLTGILAGYSGTLGAWAFIQKVLPTVTVELTFRWAAWAALLAIIGSLLGALFPAWRAARLDPIDALAHE